eukprot:5562602-Alexandrium_andersonii.AAC.1
MATIPGEAVLAVLATCMWVFLSPLANATIPGGFVLTLQACCTVLPALAVSVYSWCQSLALSFS